MNTQLAPARDELMEQVLVGGDLSALTSQQRFAYYEKVCQSMGLNPLTKPFGYLKLNGQLQLYAKRDAADQLRKLNGVSIAPPSITYNDDLVIVAINASDKTGRTDSDLGVVSIAGLKGEAKANALLKAITKAKRRVTLSICGLGWLDETEVETIPNAQVIVEDTGEIVTTQRPALQPEPPANAANSGSTNGNGHAADTPAEVAERAARRLPGLTKKLVDLNNDGGPASPDQYGFLVGAIDAITQKDAHGAVLGFILAKPVDSEHLPSFKLAGQLLDWLRETKTKKDGGGPNPNYRADVVEIVKYIWHEIQVAAEENPFEPVAA